MNTSVRRNFGPFFAKSLFLCIALMAIVLIPANHAFGEMPQWGYAGHLWCNAAQWSNYNSIGLAEGSLYRFEITEAAWYYWQPPLESWWYNRVLLETTEGTLLHTFNDLTEYETYEEALAASTPSTYSMTMDTGTSVRIWMKYTIYWDHLSGSAGCDVWQYPVLPPEQHFYAITAAYASPTRIVADGNSLSNIWVWLSRDGMPYDGEDGSEHTEYIKVTTDKGSFSEWDDAKEGWIFYNTFGGSIPLYADDTPGLANVTVEWDARNESGLNVRHLTVMMGEYSLAVSSDQSELPSDGEATATITAQVSPYNGAGGEIITMTTDKGTFSNGSNTIEAILNGAGTATATFVAPEENGYCYITGHYNYAEDTTAILALGRMLRLKVSPDELPANEALRSNFQIELLDGYYGEMYGETVTLTTDIGLFSNGSNTMQVVTGGNPTNWWLHPEQDVAGTGTVQAEWVGPDETLHDSDSVHYFSAALQVQCDQEVMWADEQAEATVLVSLFLDGVPASGGQTVYVETDMGNLSYGGTTGPVVAVPIGAGGTATMTLIASDDEGIAVITAEYPAEGLSGQCQVEMQDYRLSIVAQSANYHSVTDTSTNEYTTREFPEGESPQASTYGLTSIPVTLILTGPDVAMESFRVDLTSDAKNAVAGLGQGTIMIPDYVFVSGGTAEFTIQAENLYEYNAEQFPYSLGSIGLQATLTIDSGVGASAAFPLVDNMEMLMDYYRQSLFAGAVHSNIDDLNWLSQGLVLTGYYAGAVNNSLSYNDPQYNPFTCGGYQVQTLHFLDDLRLNYPEMNWLLNGLDYGPVKQLGGAHLAACIWPSNSDNWADPEYGLVLDPWITQNPETGVYTWEGWLSSIGLAMPIVGVALELFTDAGSSVEEVAAHYPNTGNDYPDQPYWEFDQLPGPSICVIVDCPVNVMITDGQGNHTGIDPTTPEGENPLRSDIPGLDQYPTILPNGERGWYFEIPAETVTMELSGYDTGDFTMYLLYPSGQVIPYSRADIANGQTALVIFDPNAATQPAVVYDDGSLALPDNFLAFDGWTYDAVAGQSHTTLTITNRLDQPVYTPLRLTLEHLTPSGIALVNPDANENGRDYLDFSSQLAGGVLNPGETIQRTIAFVNPDRVFFDPNAVLSAYADSAQTLPARCRWLQKGVGLAVCGDTNHLYPTGDLSKDCYVNLNDFLILADCWQQDGSSGFCTRADLASDYLIDLADLAEMTQFWLACTDPEQPCLFLP